jgi:cell division protein FtsA
VLQESGIVRKRERFVSCLDLGTNKICMVIARTAADGQPEIMGVGHAPAEGLHRGTVVDLSRASEAIRQAAQEAEAGAEVAADWVTLGIAGEHIQSYNCHGAITIEGKNSEVTCADVDQVLLAARSLPMPPSREVIHVLPQEYLLDGRGCIQNPVGLMGTRLDAHVHVVTAESALLQNLVGAVNQAQMRVKKMILQHIASAEATLTKDEKELGAAVIDIGAGTTNIAVFTRNSLRFTATVPVGGMHFTRDLAIGLRTPIEHAERIKIERGSARLEGIAEDETIDAPSVGTGEPRPMMRRFACEILHQRAVELLELAAEQLARSGTRPELMAGAVLTGGGGTLDGMAALGESILGVPVRLGFPASVRGLPGELGHPAFASAVGLALLCVQPTELLAARAARAAHSSWIVNRILSWVGG